MSNAVEFKHIDFTVIEKHVDSAIPSLRSVQNAGKYPKKVCSAAMYGANMLGAQKNIISSCRSEIKQLQQDKDDQIKALVNVLHAESHNTGYEPSLSAFQNSVDEALELLEKHK